MPVLVAKRNSDKAAQALLMLSAIAGFGLLPGQASHAAPETPSADAGAWRPTSVWVSCDDERHVAYRVVPPGRNPHNAFTHPIKVHLKPGQTCADLK